MNRTTHHTMFRIVSVVAVFAMIALQLVPFGTANAAQITTRSLTLQAGATDGGSKPGGNVNHIYTFTVPTAGNIGSIKFDYCTTASGACTPPTGLDTTLNTATLGSTTGISGFSLKNTIQPGVTNGSPYITNAAAPSVGAGTAITVPINGMVNPTTYNTTFFVRISTFTSTDATGTAVDTGTVTAAVTNPIVISGTMPESLVFCAATTIGLNVSNVPDCTTAASGVVSFNQLFSPTDTATATSQMAASTNAGAGYNITVNGATLTSGSNTIAGMPAAANGVHGTSQFGLNLKANTAATSTAPVGTEVAPAADGLRFKGQAVIGYNSVDNFKFVSGNSVADSANGGAGGTDAQLFTVSYIANVPGNLPAGTYSTTLTYVCTATY
jgi:hypothetical protein